VDFPSSRCLFCYCTRPHVIRQFQHEANVLTIVGKRGFEPLRSFRTSLRTSMLLTFGSFLLIASFSLNLLKWIASPLLPLRLLLPLPPTTHDRYVFQFHHSPIYFQCTFYGFHRLALLLVDTITEYFAFHVTILNLKRH